MTIDDQIREGKMQYDINREAEKIPVFITRQNCEYLT